MGLIETGSEGISGKYHALSKIQFHVKRKFALSVVSYRINAPTDGHRKLPDYKLPVFRYLFLRKHNVPLAFTFQNRLNISIDYFTPPS